MVFELRPCECWVNCDFWEEACSVGDVGAQVCDSGLRRLFNLPVDCQRLWLHADPATAGRPAAGVWRAKLHYRAGEGGYYLHRTDIAASFAHSLMREFAPGDLIDFWVEY